MALLEKQLVIKTSQIPDSGMGLFTEKFIAKGTLILEYKGRITTWKEVEFDSENGYIYAINDDRVIDAEKNKKSLARYANDALGSKRIKGLTNNCIYVNDGQKAFIKSMKDIAAGGEIFVHYGKEYWDVKKTNIAIDKLAAQKAAKNKK